MKNLALSMLDAGGAFRLARRLARRRLLVLTYHHVLPRPEEPARDRPSNVVYADEFAQQLQYLTTHCHIVSGDELRAHLHGQALPPHSVLVTFDDGYRNNYKHAFPALKAHGATAVFFLTSGFIGDRRNRLWFDRLDASVAHAPEAVGAWLRSRTTLDGLTLDEFRRMLKQLPSRARDALVAGVEHAAACVDARSLPKDRVEPMSWAEVREMADAGMLIGAHTVTHQILSSASADDVMTELATSRAAIEANTGRDCWCFSYPNGEAADFRDVDALMLKSCGFECAFTQLSGFVDARANRYTLPRVPVPSTSDFRAFLTRGSGLLPLLTHSTTGIRRWSRAS